MISRYCHYKSLVFIIISIYCFVPVSAEAREKSMAGQGQVIVGQGGVFKGPGMLSPGQPGWVGPGQPGWVGPGQPGWVGPGQPGVLGPGVQSNIEEQLGVYSPGQPGVFGPMKSSPGIQSVPGVQSDIKSVPGVQSDVRSVPGVQPNMDKCYGQTHFGQTAYVAGKVIDASGEPIPGLQVSIFNPKFTNLGRFPSSYTDILGNFVIQEVPIDEFPYFVEVYWGKDLIYRKTLLVNGYVNPVIQIK